MDFDTFVRIGILFVFGAVIVFTLVCVLELIHDHDDDHTACA